MDHIYKPPPSKHYWLLFLGFAAALYSYLFKGDKTENGPVMKVLVAVPIISHYLLKVSATMVLSQFFGITFVHL